MFELETLGKVQKELSGKVNESVDAATQSLSNLNAGGVLDNVPRVALHMLELEEGGNWGDWEKKEKVAVYAKYLRQLAYVEWLFTMLTDMIRSANSSGPGHHHRSNNDLWTKELLDKSSKDEKSIFMKNVEKLGILHRSSQLEVSRCRSEEGYEEREVERFKGEGVWHPKEYILRITSIDGAVVRDGVSIDNCANLGTCDIGEIVISHDRVVNESGVMRYKNDRGWISESTRGQGKEPICEVIAVVGGGRGAGGKAATMEEKIVFGPFAECGILDLCR